MKRFVGKSDTYIRGMMLCFFKKKNYIATMKNIHNDFVVSKKDHTHTHTDTQMTSINPAKVNFVTKYNQSLKKRLK